MQSFGITFSMVQNAPEIHQQFVNRRLLVLGDNQGGTRGTLKHSVGKSHGERLIFGGLWIALGTLGRPKAFASISSETFWELF